MSDRQPLSIQVPPPSSGCLFEGELAFCSLADLLQLVCTCHRSAEIEIHESTELVGKIVIRSGFVVSAVSCASSAEIAFFELCRRPSGRFRVLAVSREREAEIEATSMRVPWRELLFEAARLEDEGSRGDGREAGGERDRRSSDYLELTLSTHPPPASEGGRVIPLRRVHPAPLAGGDVGGASRDAALSSALAAYLARDFVGALRMYEACLAAAPADARIQLMIERIRARLTHG